MNLYVCVSSFLYILFCAKCSIIFGILKFLTIQDPWQICSESVNFACIIICYSSVFLLVSNDFNLSYIYLIFCCTVLCIFLQFLILMSTMHCLLIWLAMYQNDLVCNSNVPIQKGNLIYCMSGCIDDKK